MHRSGGRLYDVCVIGGGPAGAAIGQVLARLGHDVAIVEQARFPRSRVGESLPPSIWPLLEALGVRETVESAGFLRYGESEVLWGDAAGIRSPRGVAEAGLQVDRGRFDAILLDAARSAGATVLQPATARRPERSSTGSWRVPVASRDDRTELAARYLVDAGGRRGCLRGARRTVSRPTYAVFAYWQACSLPDAATRVEAGAEYRVWGAPLPGGLVNAAVFLDPARLRSPECNGRSHSGSAFGGEGAREKIGCLYEAIVRSSRLLGAALRDARCGQVRVCNATPIAATVAAGEDWCRVGEAGFAIDPLSSQGVQAAIASALRGAAVVNTVLRRPADGDVAIRFHNARQETTLARHLAWSREQYAQQARITPTPFWTARADGSYVSLPPPHEFSADANPAGAAAAGSANQIASHRGGAVRPLEPGDRIRLSPGCRVIETEIVRDYSIVRGAALAGPRLRGPIAFLGNFELAPLLQRLGNGMTVESLLAAACRGASPRPALMALQELQRLRLIECTRDSGASTTVSAAR